MPATPERVLRAIQARGEPRREGKRVIFDEEISLATVSSNGGAGFLEGRVSAPPFQSWEGREELSLFPQRDPPVDRRRAGAAAAGFATSPAPRCPATHTSTPSK